MVSLSSAARFIGIKEIKNARQLGGYIGADGRKVKDGLLIRTAGLDQISYETAKELSDKFNVKYVVDFRMEYERQILPDREIPNAQNVWISVFEMNTNAPENIEMMNNIRKAEGKLQKNVEYAKSGRLSALYTDILLGEMGQRGYAQFFDILLNNKDGAVLWHCTHGKDRTGVAAALVLYALGVDEDIIMQDFLLTNEVYKDNIARLKATLEEIGCDDFVISEVQAMAGVKGEYLTAALDAVKSEYGSVQDYIRNQLGVSDEKIEKLRNLYLE